MLSNAASLLEANITAQYHNLTMANYDNCIAKLKSAYSIDADIMIIKSEDRILKNGTLVISIITDYYNFDTRVKLDQSKCEGNLQQFKIPISVSDQEKVKYVKLEQEGIDIFNKTDPAFRTSCVAYSDPDRNYDTTLSYRLNGFISNRTDCQVIGCSYDSFSVAEGYINCNCDKKDLTENEPGNISKSVLSCATEVNVIISKL
jgi:hypothetical protein